MKKMLYIIGTAGAVLSSASAYAQSNVILYGVTDAAVEYSNHQPGMSGGSASRVALQSGGWSGSRWGMRGVEDLGGNIKSFFALEGGVGIDTGSMQQGGRIFGRQAFVGLEWRGSRLSLGRQYTSLFDAFGNYSPTYLAAFYEPVFYWLGASLREDNVAKYAFTSGPLTATVHWSAGERAGSLSSNAGWGGSAAYEQGRFSVALGYDEVHPAVSAASNNYGKEQKAAVGLKYADDAFRVVGGYRYGRNLDANGNVIRRDDYWWLGVTYQVTRALAVTGAFFYDDLKSVVSNGQTSNPRNPYEFELLTSYSLSKRTDAYFMVGYAKNSALNFDTYNPSSVASYSLGAGKTNQTGIAIGLRHKF